ncbi:DnaD domain protein [Virgibacillus dakarensis]|nr:DnaD domain protein [Virgibacillus dakarensis]
MGGWIKFHRKILDNELWHDVTTFRLFTLLLLRASHKDGLKIKGIEINRGQYLRSYSKLAEDLEFKEGRGYKKVSKSTIKRSVQKLIDNGMVTVRETDNGTVFSIVKYHEYQDLDEHEQTINGTGSSTLTERTQNEVGTNPEQEQELKNYRIKEIDNNNNNNESEVGKIPTNPFTYYQQNFEPIIPPAIVDKIKSWLEDFSDEMLVLAMEKTMEQDEHKRTWAYINRILVNWHKKQIKTPKQAKEADEKFYSRQNSYKRASGYATYNEVVPDWFKNRNNKQQKPADPIPHQETPEEKEEFEALLREFTSKGVNG